MLIKCQTGTMKGTDHLGNKNTDGKIILQWMRQTW
jgi:hypothetical protein